MLSLMLMAFQTTKLYWHKKPGLNYTAFITIFIKLFSNHADIVQNDHEVSKDRPKPITPALILILNIIAIGL